jgi:hypothetical protein
LIRNNLARVTLALILVVGAAGTAATQQPAPAAGTKVRIWSDSVMTGVLLAMNDDSIRFAKGKSTEVSLLALSAVRELDVSTHRESHTLKGLAIGAAVGLISGFALNLATAPGPGEASGPYTNAGSLNFGLALGGVGAVAGAAVGGIIGVAWKTDHWEPVPLTEHSGR